MDKVNLNYFYIHKILVPILNLNSLTQLNYDSEKEFFLDSKDKLNKIKTWLEKRQ